MDGIGEGDLETGEEVSCGGAGRGGEDDRGNTGRGQKTRAPTPDAGVVEGPEESADRDDDDQSDDHTAEELELSMDAARLEIVWGSEVVAAERRGLEGIDAADGEPSERDDKPHGKNLAKDIRDVIGNPWNGRQDDAQACDKEDGARGMAQVLLDAPSHDPVFGFFAKNAEDDVMRDVGDDDDAAEEEEGEEPRVAEVFRNEGGKLHG